ncbi:MAG: sulfite exporter TauE/SafE family protein [Chitinophagales bacterium]
MEYWHFIVLVLIGIVVGFINVISGGGSLITLPILIFFGLDSTVANASNRIGNIAQNIFALAGFKSKGVTYSKYTFLLGFSAALGAIPGTFMALYIPDNAFNKILAIVMLVVVIIIVFGPKTKSEDVVEYLESKHKALGMLAFFFIGVYGGFIQAGTGLLIMAALSLINKMSFVKINTFKVVVVLFYLSVAFGIFLYYGQVNWAYGLSLGVGTSIGGWLSSRWSIDKGDVWIKRFMVVSVCALAFKLLFFS